MVGTSFGWGSAPQCQTSCQMAKLMMFSIKHVTTASTGATRIIYARFASEISPKQLVDNRSRFLSSCFDLGWKASDKAHYGKGLYKDGAICMV